MKKVALIKAVIETESIQIAEWERGFINVNLSKMELTHNVDIAIELMVNKLTMLYMSILQHINKFPWFSQKKE